MVSNHLIPLLEQGYKLWRVVNEVRHAGKLPDPLLVVASNSRLKDQNRLGWCTIDKVWTQAKTQADVKEAPGAFEVGLAAEHLHRPVDGILATWLHEFAHYGNWANGIHDANPNTQYHNGKFKAEAERLGLVVEKTEGRGWAHTTLGPGARELIAKANLDESVFAWCRLNGAAGAGRAKQPTKMKLWMCACGTKIRAAKELHIRCEECGELFKRPDEEGEED